MNEEREFQRKALNRLIGTKNQLIRFIQYNEETLEAYRTEVFKLEEQIEDKKELLKKLNKIGVD